MDLVHPFEVANEFLALSWKEKRHLRVSRLHKYIFLSFGWYLALSEMPMFNEHFSAERLGPVLSSVKKEFRSCGIEPIERYAKLLNTYSPHASLEDIQFIAPKLKNKEVKGVVLKVWGIYKDWPPAKLTESLCNNSSPWGIARRGKDYRTKIIIPNEIILDYFKSFLL